MNGNADKTPLKHWLIEYYVENKMILQDWRIQTC